MEVIIIRKIFSFFLVLVVITSISFTAFAAGEQPSGSNYQYRDYGTHTGYDTFWVAANKNLQYIGNYVYNSSNYLFTLQSLVSDIKLAVDPSSSPAYSTPSGQNYNYYSFSDAILTSNFWDATNLQLQYISNRINLIRQYQSSISGKVTSIESSMSSINTSASSIATSTTSIDGKLPSGNYGYIGSGGEYVPSSQSNYTWWRAIANDLFYGMHEVFTISNKLPNGNYAYIRQNGTVNSQANSTFNFWTAISTSLANIGEDIHASGLDIDDLHTMFASPEDLALKADQENNISAATSNFLSGSDSSTSVGTGGIGKVKDLGDGVSDFFDPGVSSSNLFTLLSDNSSDGPWMWFTQAVADDLDGVAASNRNKRSSSSESDVVDFYGAKMDELDKLLGGLADD